MFVNGCQKSRVGIRFCHGVWRVVGEKCLGRKSVKGEEAGVGRVEVGNKSGARDDGAG